MQPRHSQTGFTVLELMIAFLLLAFGVTGVGILLQSSLRSDQASQYSRGVNTMAVDVVEDIKSRAVSKSATDFKNLQAAGENVTTAGEMAGVSGLWYRYRWQVRSDIDIVPPAGPICGANVIKRIKVVNSQTGLAEDLPSGLLQLDITIGWDNCPTGDPDPCHCKRTSRFTSFIRPDGS